MMRFFWVILAGLLASASAQAQCVGSLQANNNLSDVCNAATARANIGAGTGGGSVTSITAGTGLTGGTITTSGTIALDTLTMGQLPAASKTVAITFIIDGGGSAITTGIKGDLSIPFACTITGARLLLDQSGSIVVDVWKDTYANYPPVVGDSITASAKPTVSSATKSDDTTLTGWTTSITAGDTLRFNVDSITTTTRATLTLTCVKS